MAAPRCVAYITKAAFKKIAQLINPNIFFQIFVIYYENKNYFAQK